MTHPVSEFLKSESFIAYAAKWNASFHEAINTLEDSNGIGVDGDKLSLLPVGLQLEFCQLFWESLPDHENIQHGAFFSLCDYAEEYCFGSEG